MKIVVDSACDYNIDLLNKLGIKVERIPFNLQLDDSLYVDDENLDVNSFIDHMLKSNVVKTSAPSPELFLEKYKGDESVFVITISQHLSAAYSNAILAKQMYLDEFGEKFIHIFDSTAAGAGETILLVKLAECIKKNLSESEIVEEVDNFLKNSKTYFILERYDNLVRNGRMNAMVAKVASFLSIKPICAAIEGRAEMIDKAMGTQKAYMKIASLIGADKEICKDRTLSISHVRCKDKAELIKNEILKQASFKEVLIIDTFGLCSTYANDQGLIIAF
ncbi:DegV family protein [Anaeropeptidivorans aminofermentans]|jgi:DegV family protein with EDD domain|uniref:DegV family protein n=1 Tax=Anaeropeptidivorans aminofermentans TaxID=2934315 RepID=UPI0020249425|nr:DegV family protein [Anaeropeptidivorans aminofermentans]